MGDFHFKKRTAVVAQQGVPRNAAKNREMASERTKEMAIARENKSSGQRNLPTSYDRPKTGVPARWAKLPGENPIDGRAATAGGHGKMP